MPLKLLFLRVAPVPNALASLCLCGSISRNLCVSPNKYETLLGRYLRHSTLTEC
jgi:hypothetical protein